MVEDYSSQELASLQMRIEEAGREYRGLLDALAIRSLWSISTAMPRGGWVTNATN